MPKHRNHLFFMSTLGLGLALAIVLDGLFGGVKKKSFASSGPEIEEIPEGLPGPEPELNENQNEQESGSLLNTPETSDPNPNPDPGPDSEPGPDTEGMDYRSYYLKMMEKKKRKREKKIISEINANAYIGSGDKQSRRLYLLQQAYKASRDATPIINVKPMNTEEEDYDDDLDELFQEIVSDDEEDEEQEEEEERVFDTLSVKPRNKDFRNTSTRKTIHITKPPPEMEVDGLETEEHEEIKETTNFSTGHNILIPNY